MKKINPFVVIFAFLFAIVLAGSCTKNDGIATNLADSTITDSTSTDSSGTDGTGNDSDSTGTDSTDNGSENGEVEYSSFGDTESAGMSGNCISCHYQGGSGEGVFSMGGTVYDSTKTQIYTDATIYLYTDANGSGTLVDSLQTDAYGHFYTTKNIDFSQGLFPVLQGKTGNSNSMSVATTSGACYSCHGTNSTPNIWIK